MISLSIDASTPICDLAIRNSLTNEVLQIWEEGKGIHSERIATGIAELCNSFGIQLQDVDEWILTSGPGSYTGLRIAASLIKGCLFNSEKKIKGVQTLAFFAKSMSNKYSNHFRFHAILDARRTHVYHQFFEILDHQIKTVGDVTISPIVEVQEWLKNGDVLGGTGIERFDQNTLIEKEIQIGSLQDTINPVILSRFNEAHASWSPFIKEYTPELFEPDYYNSGIAQVSIKH